MTIFTRWRATLARTFKRLFPGRFAVAGIVVVAYLAVSLLTRVGLAIFNGEATEFMPWRVAGWLLIGLAYDLAAAAFWLLPMALLAWLWPARRAHRAFGAAAIALAMVAFGIFVFTAASEFVFWNEFSSSFNFIAVDYLIYTREVIGNIRESYRMTPILLGLAAATAVLVVLAVRPLWRAAQAAGPGFGRRSLQQVLEVERLPELDAALAAAADRDAPVRVPFTAGVDGKRILLARFPLKIKLVVHTTDGRRAEAVRDVE